MSVPFYEKGNYKLTSADTAEFYVSIPTAIGAPDYKQVKSGSYSFSPGESFFVQVAKSCNISFNKSPNKVNTYNETTSNTEFNLSISNNTDKEDLTTIIHNAKAPMNEYYAMYDLTKMATYDSIPRIYIKDHDSRLVFSTINFADYTQVEVGVYTPEAGEYTLYFPCNEYLSLYDAAKDITVNVNEYTFSSDSAGHISDRFYIHINKIPTSNECIEVEKSTEPILHSNNNNIYVSQINDGDLINLYHSNGALIASQIANGNTSIFKSLNTGVYIVKIINKTSSTAKKITVL